MNFLATMSGGIYAILGVLHLIYAHMISESGHVTFGLWIAHCFQLCGTRTQRLRQLAGTTGRAYSVST
jgi:hypothetical protein